jgi:hypothetical protein
MSEACSLFRLEVWDPPGKLLGAHWNASSFLHGTAVADFGADVETKWQLIRFLLVACDFDGLITTNAMMVASNDDGLILTSRYPEPP